MQSKRLIVIYFLVGTIAFLTSLVMIFIKLTGIYNLSWIIALSPVAILFSVVTTVCILILFIFCIQNIVEKKKTKYITRDIYD